MNTNTTLIAKNIAALNGRSEDDYIAEVLNDPSAEEGFFQELETLASSADTTSEVLDAIYEYTNSHLNLDFSIDKDDPYLWIRAQVEGTRRLKDRGVRSLTISRQVDEADWEVPNIPEYEDSSEFRDAVVEAFEAYNDVSLEEEAFEYFKSNIEDVYRPY